MKLELTDSKKRLLLIAFAISGWTATIFLFVYLFASNKENEIQPFEEGLRVFAANLGGEIYKKIGSKTVAFFNFTNFQDEKTNLGSYIAQRVLPYLLKDKNIIVVDRRYLIMTIKENKFQATGMAAPTNALKSGMISGVEYFLIGKAEYADGYISISAQLIDVNTNIVSISSSTNVVSNEITYRISGEEEKDRKVSFLFFGKLFNFTKENYQWLWTAIVIPIVGWFIRAKKKATLENNEDAIE